VIPAGAWACPDAHWDREELALSDQYPQRRRTAFRYLGLSSCSCQLRQCECCRAALTTDTEARITKSAWGETPGRQKVDLYRLDNGQIMVSIATYGGMLVDLKVPDRDGKTANVIRGMDRLEDYFSRHTGLYGSIVGRYGNRIKGGRFVLDGKTYLLPVNSQGNTLHGGPIGFDQRVWTAKSRDGRAPSLTLSYTSLDGEMNFPGTLKTQVRYTLSGGDLSV